MDAPTSAARLLRGVVPVLEVAFDDDEQLDLGSFERVVAHTLATGVSAVMFPGFASEYYKLDEHERDRLVARLLDQTRDRHDVAAVVSVHDHSTAVALRRAARLVADGADALNLLPPHFLGPTAAAVRAHLDAVLDAVAPTPVILQYAPAQTDSSLDPAILAEVAGTHANFAAVKVEATPPGRLVQALTEQHPPLPALIGYAGLQLPDALRRGVVGVQPGCSFTELYVSLWQSWHAGRREDALALHTRMLPYLAYWMQDVELVIAAEKLVSARRGLIDRPVCRQPAHVLDAEEVSMVERFLDEFAHELAAESPLVGPDAAYPGTAGAAASLVTEETP